MGQLHAHMINVTNYHNLLVQFTSKKIFTSDIFGL